MTIGVILGALILGIGIVIGAAITSINRNNSRIDED